MRPLLAVLLTLTTSGCVTMRTGMEVDLALNAVQRPQDVAERWGAYTLVPSDSSGFTYTDDLISIAVVALAGSFQAILTNRTEHSIRLLWSEASYVGPNGLSSGVVPGNTRWIDMGNAPAPQLIPTESKASISIIPRANANTSSMSFLGFYDTGATCAEVAGTEIRLILPVEIEGITNEYTFRFQPRKSGIVTWKTDTMKGKTTEESRDPCPDVSRGTRGAAG